MEIAVDVTNRSNEMLLHQHVGEGKCNGLEFRLSVTLPDHSPHIRIGDTVYVVPVSNIIKAVVAAHIEESEQAEDDDA